MRLFEAVIEANHRAADGDHSAGLHPSQFADSLPVVALTCIDPRLNPLLPNALGLRDEDFIWLRNAGNIITGPTSSTMRSLALACAVKGGHEIAILGHTDCRVGQTGSSKLMEAFLAQGVERARLPDNLPEFFGMFASERANVIKAVDIARSSPLIGPKVPIHGLVLDLQTGRVEWVVNGYDTASGLAPTIRTALERGSLPELMSQLPQFALGEMKFPEGKIGETALSVGQWLADHAQPSHPSTASSSESRQAAHEASAESPETPEEPAQPFHLEGNFPRPAMRVPRPPPIPPSMAKRGRK